MGAFGEKLRKQRELRGIDLDAISNTTKISTRMLRALEDEHFDQLPGGVFNKGFVRAYARQIGLDEEEAVADYFAALNENQLRESVLPDCRSGPAKPSPDAAPDLGHELHTNQLVGNEPRDKVLPTPDLPADTNPADTNPADTDDDRNHQIHELGREDRREPDRRNEDRRNHHDRRNRERRNHDRRDQDRHPRFRLKYPAGDPAQPAGTSSAQVPWGMLALALTLITLILAFWNFHRHGQPTAASPTVASSNQSPAPASAPVSAPTQPSSSAPTLTAAPASRAGTMSARTASPPTITAATTPGTSPAPPALPAPAAPAPPASSVSPATAAAGSAAKPAANVPQPNAKPPAPHAAARAPAAKPPSSFTLQIRADETTWITLTADDKPVVANETLIAPAHTSVRATREIVVKTGNAAGLSFLLNGKEISAHGNEGEPRTYIFDATGLRTAPQTQPPATNR